VRTEAERHRRDDRRELTRPPAQLNRAARSRAHAGVVEGRWRIRHRLYVRVQLLYHPPRGGVHQRAAATTSCTARTAATATAAATCRLRLLWLSPLLACLLLLPLLLQLLPCPGLGAPLRQGLRRACLRLLLLLLLVVLLHTLCRRWCLLRHRHRATLRGEHLPLCPAIACTRDWRAPPVQQRQQEGVEIRAPAASRDAQVEVRAT